MPRGVRRTNMEKLQEELVEVRESISQYESCLVTLKEKEAYLAEQVKLEEYKHFASILDDSGLSLDELMELIKKNTINNEKQSA